MKGRRNNSQEQKDPPSPDPTCSPTVPPPPFEWKEQAEYLGPILRHSSLPLVVKCDRRGLPSMEHINFDLSQALLLHTRRTVRKVVASSVLHVQHGGVAQLKEVGDHLLIPEDYKGQCLYIDRQTLFAVTVPSLSSVYPQCPMTLSWLSSDHIHTLQ